MELYIKKELKGMQKKAWLETLERGFFGKRSGKNEDSENNSVEKEVFEEEFSEKQHTDKYKEHLRIPFRPGAPITLYFIQ